MKTATIVLPRNDNSGSPLPFIHSMLAVDLLKEFGGFTVSDKHGSWKDSDTGRVYSEICAHYEIAAEWTPDSESILSAIAARYCALAEQFCVFLTRGNGESEFVSPCLETLESLRAMRAQKLAA